LRRLLVNDDDKHDYFSRGSTLQIRDTGVYAVYGSEDRGKVEWKFEYLVQPRISASTGETVPNEKVRQYHKILCCAAKVIFLAVCHPTGVLCVSIFLQPGSSAPRQPTQHCQEATHTKSRIGESKTTTYRQTTSRPCSPSGFNARSYDPYVRCYCQSSDWRWRWR
jgi:hypothetical protein